MQRIFPWLITGLMLAAPAVAGGPADRHRSAPPGTGPAATAAAPHPAQPPARSNSRSTATGGAATGGNASSEVTVYDMPGTATTAPGGGQGGGRGGGQRVPDLLAPALPGGGSCTVGASSGISLPGFGLIGGGSWEGKGCERRQIAALLDNMGQRAAAIEVLCTNDDVREAMKRVGRPCAADHADLASMVLTVTPTPAQTAPRTIPDWCYSASSAERRARPACAVSRR